MTTLSEAAAINKWITARIDEMQKDVTPINATGAKAYTHFTTDYILAEIASKRRIIDVHNPAKGTVNGQATFVCVRCVHEITWRPLISEDDCNHEHEQWPCNAIRETAAPFAGQAGYLPEWCPDDVTLDIETGDGE